MRVKIGKRGLLAAAALTGAVVYYRVRQSRDALDREWEEDIATATAEGEAAARAAVRDDRDV